MRMGFDESLVLRKDIRWDVCLRSDMNKIAVFFPRASISLGDKLATDHGLFFRLRMGNKDCVANGKFF